MTFRHRHFRLSSLIELEWHPKLNRKGGFTSLVFPYEFLQHNLLDRQFGT